MKPNDPKLVRVAWLLSRKIEPGPSVVAVPWRLRRIVLAERLESFLNSPRIQAKARRARRRQPKK